VFDERCEKHALIPPNTTAIVQVPAAQVDAVRESGRGVTEAVGMRLLRAEGGAVELDISSSDYRFVVD
jgi:hypothetical protein